MNLRSIVLTIMAAGSVAACESANPAESGLDAGGAGGGSGAQSCEADKGLAVRDAPSCTPLATDYQPRDHASSNDTWPACISDDGAYHPFDASVGSNARTAAFVEMGKLLGFGGGKVPTPNDFLDAKVAYSQPEGLQSRLSRREDTHFPAVMLEGKETACRDLTADQIQANPDRCVGPAFLEPLIETALNEGAKGSDPVLNAARVEAGLLWFFYIAVFKEIETCGTGDKKDCDSSTGYYGGAQTRANPIGFASYVKARSSQAHDRVWDGLLAVRCWRDLDSTVPLGNLDLRKQAQAQVDRAMLRGLALIVRERLQNVAACGAAFETVRVLGPALHRAAAEIDKAQAATLAAEVAKKDAVAVDVKAATAALDALFPCP